MDVNKLLGYWEKDNNNKSLIMDIANAYATNGRSVEAFEFFESLSEHIKSDSQLNWQFAHLCIATGNFDNAKSVLANLGKNEPAFCYGMALISFLQNQFEDARRHLASLLKNNNPGVAVIILEMRSLYYLGELDAALKLGLKYSGTEDSHELNGLISIIAFDLNKFDTAEEYARKTLAQSPTQMDAALSMASLFVNKQLFDEALPICQMINQQYQGSGRAWSLTGQIYLVKNQLNDAKSCFDAAVQRMPDHIGTWHLKAWCELLTDDISSAQSSFQKALELNRNFADSHAGVALVMIFQGNIAAAQQKIKIARKLDRDCQTAIFAESLLLRNEGKTESADALVAGIISQQSHIEGQTYQALLAKFTK